MDLINKNLKSVILWPINAKPKRLLKLKCMIKGIRQKMLIENLTDLENM